MCYNHKAIISPCYQCELRFFAEHSQELEKDQILEQYRTLSSETERLVSDAKVSAGKVSSYHMELLQKERAEREMGDKIRRLETDIEEVKCSLLNHKMHVINNSPHVKFWHSTLFENF